MDWMRVALFFVRAIILGIIIHKYGWKAMFLAFAYAVLTGIDATV